ncbi:virulence RhuM family protein [Congregibacter litoralis]|uniref:Virulence protein RhuM family n=1 Tax=Congregibacter litoralis KT71 TaxID=314285 RepID=A4A4L3_9GAMM|nr:RhuM family protein [Congregibacter litoralis]EAQ98734.1 Virulence protein RhuM family [Congregibacter litoralis KT71]
MTSDDLPVASEIEEVDVSQQQQDVQIFQAPDGQIRLDVKFQQDTVWLTQAQMTVLFERDQSVISRHINNVFKDGELSAESNMQKMHIAHSDKTTACYSLDVIISVGYRVKSQRGVQFRQWATGVLRQHLVDGYTLNQQRLEGREVEVEQALDPLSRTLANQQLVSAKGEAVLQVIAEYARSWSLLQGYDERSLSGQSKRAGWSECSGQFVQN